jgi:hypothetical protein
MGRRAPDHAVDTARVLLVDYYSSGRRRHTFDSIASRSGLSRATVARLARDVRCALPTITSLECRLASLQLRVERLEGSSGRAGS